MKRIITAIFLGACLAGTASARQLSAGAGNVRLQKGGDRLNVSLDLDLKDVKPGHDRAVLVTPLLVNGSDTVRLKTAGVYGRTRYYHFMRNDGRYPSDAAMTWPVSKRPAEVGYSDAADWQPWMNGCSLVLEQRAIGCCDRTAEQVCSGPLREFVTYEPEWVFVSPGGSGDKSFSLTGQAYIDFPVDKTVIYPDYRRNTVELAKIQATIDSVRDDRDITITRVWLKGFASPESPYAHNTDLAKGRTAALKAYIQNLYRFADGVIATDYEPEDWEGLRRFVSASNMEHRAEIVELIDADMDPDAKEARIKRLYPDEYRFMLQSFYPALRHTDYRIDYNVRHFTDLDDIRRLFRAEPYKLGLDELYLLARTYEPGSEEFNEVFETAVRLHPSDPVANINAANSAMQRGDLAAAGRYLAKAGDSAEAEYARGVLAALGEDYAKALGLMERAAEAGIGQAAEAAEVLRKLI